MEKKVDKTFLILSSVNVVAAIILAGGDLKDSLALIGVLIVLVFNHLILKKIVTEVTLSMRASGRDAQRAQARILIFMFGKFCLLGGVIAAIYFYKNSLTLKVMILMIFQLIIQVLSIKNNNQN